MFWDVMGVFIWVLAGVTPAYTVFWLWRAWRTFRYVNRRVNALSVHTRRGDFSTALADVAPSVSNAQLQDHGTLAGIILDQVFAEIPRRDRDIDSPNNREMWKARLLG